MSTSAPTPTTSAPRPQIDPLIEQTQNNKLKDPAPTTSGSAPWSDAERRDGAPVAGEKNAIEQKLEDVFDVEKKDRTIGGAGVGVHPKF